MPTSRHEQILAIFDECENMYPDKSLEWLTAMTLDILGDETIDEADVAEALVARADATMEAARASWTSTDSGVD